MHWIWTDITLCSKEMSWLFTTKPYFQPFPKWQILDSSKLNEFVDNNFKLDENGRKLSKQAETV